MKITIPILLSFGVLLHLYYVIYIEHMFQYNNLTFTSLTLSLIWLVYLIKHIEKEYKKIFYILVFLLILSFIIHCSLPLIQLI
jgi:hypothetical protein